MDTKKARLAILFADVSDSTRLYEALGDTAAFGGVREVIESLTGVTKAFRGRVVKTIGDGLMCAFPDADAAASAAAEMQRHIAQLPPLARDKFLTIRVGFHCGPVIEDGDDVYGDTVNVAARMAGLALAGQVITTSDAVASLSSSLRDAMRQIHALPVKGKTEEIDVHELIWRASVDSTVIPGRIVSAVPAVAAGGPSITLIYRDREIVMKGTVYLGRDDSNTVFIMDPVASRRHAKIELRAGRFVLVDQSANGTYVTLGPSAEMKLRREEAILYGSGVIAFGHSASEPGAETVQFRCGAETGGRDSAS